MRTSHVLCGLFLAFACSTSLASAQAAAKPNTDLAAHPDQPKADPADVGSIEAVVKAFYSAISAAPGAKLDHNRLDSLFIPSGRIAVGLPSTASRPADINFRTPEQYADGFDARPGMFGFYDHNPANQIEQFGVMAHVYSTYESRNDPAAAKPMARGIKSFELLNSNNRWYIVSVYWDSERPGNPLPERYLHHTK